MEIQTNSLNTSLGENNENNLTVNMNTEVQPCSHNDLNNRDRVSSISLGDNSSIGFLNSQDVNENEHIQSFQNTLERRSDYSVNTLEGNVSKDSEPSQDISIDKQSSSPQKDNSQNTNRLKKNKHLRLFNSDSEEENMQLNSTLQSISQSSQPEYNENKKRKLKRIVVESDSDVENKEVTPHNKSFSDDNIDRHEEVIFSTTAKGKLVPEVSNSELATIHQKSRLSALCDPDSDEDYNNQNEDSNLVEEIKPKPYKRKKLKKQGDEVEPKKMTGKDAVKQRMKIKSESQRMFRERNISLPYHKPKSHTLKEFFTLRPKLAEAVPCPANTPASIAIKMSAEQLAIMSKNIQEREEKLKQFYRSESESDDDGDRDYILSEELNKDDLYEEKNNASTATSKSCNLDGNAEKNNKSGTNIEITGDLEHVKENMGTNKTTQILDELNERGDGQSVSVNNFTENNKEESNVSSNLDNCVNDPVAIDKSSEEPVGLNTEKEIIISNEDNENNLSASKENNDISDNANNIKEGESCSMDYEFNLDDLEENSEKIVLDKEVNMDISGKQSSFQYTDLDKEIENFGEDKETNIESIKVGKKLSKLELIRENLAHIKPRLSGCPDDVIDLDSGVTKPNEISKLMERFAKHTSTKHAHKNKVKLSIVSIESGEIHKETVAMTVDEDDLPVVEEKPGAKLQRLRNELQSQIAQKRSELWQKKKANIQEGEGDPYKGEKEECGAEDDFLDDGEEEAEFTDSSEDDVDENIRDTEKDKVKSDFIDEEAEESDAENENFLEDDEEDDDDKAVDNDQQIDGVSENESNGIESTEELPVKRPLKRILKGFTEDSDDDEELNLSSQTLNSKEPVKQNVNNENSQDDDDFIPPHQPQASQTPIKKTIQTQGKPEFEFLTPISYITGLQNLNNSASKCKDTPITTIQPDHEPSPLKENNWQHGLQKKLFTNMEITDSQVEDLCSDKFPETQSSNEADEELANMCSGKFPSTLGTEGNESQPKELGSEKVPFAVQSQSDIRTTDEPSSTQDLLNMCSGAFTGITQIEIAEKPEVTKIKDTYQFGTNKEIKSLDEDQELIISQLLDEEEMENFKRKFDSPMSSNTQKSIVQEFEEVVGSGRVIDSDDEDEVLEVKKKKNQKKLTFSDDENSDEDERDNEEVIDLHDDVDDVDEVADSIIDYDSEENEIEYTEETQATKRLKASDFLENEAELSESEWESADEDEKNLDTLEFEQGDTEKFDENKIKEDLERLHVRQLLDDDVREVKLLQELLLEDGELHGSGRERQFRWKNSDLVDDNAYERKEEDDVYLEEVESEEKYRKTRYEREMFLKEKSQSMEDDDDLVGKSQLLKIGHKVMQRSQVHSQSSTPIEVPKADPASPVAKQPFSLLNKRGSFLKRGDEVLQRLAEYNKTTTVIIGAAKNSKSFLFQSVSEQTSISDAQNKKRKATDGTPNVLKKLRLSSNLSPAVSKKKPDKSARAKLFGNW